MNLSGVDIDVCFGVDGLSRKFTQTVSTNSGVKFVDTFGGIIQATSLRAGRVLPKLTAPSNVVVDVFIVTARGTLNEKRDFLGRTLFALSEGVEAW